MDDRFTLNIDHLDGPGGSYFGASRAEHYANCKMRLPKQTVMATGATVIGANDVIPGYVTYPWAYPRRPSALTGWHRPQNGAIADEDRVAVCQVRDLRSDQMRMHLFRVNGTNWAAAKDVVLNAEVWVDDL